MSSKTQNVGHSVEYRLKRIVNSSSDGVVKASLANLRRGIGTAPGDIPELWELFLQDLPEEMLSRSGVPTHAQWAVYIALTLFALHQQGKDLQKESMYRQENGLGKAVTCLIHGEDDKTRIQRRFNVLATSADIQELAHHLRGMIQLLRSEGIPLDYPELAKDLYLYQNEDYRSQVRLRWGQDFYRRKTTETGKEDSNETEKATLSAPVRRPDGFRPGRLRQRRLQLQRLRVGQHLRLTVRLHQRGGYLPVGGLCPARFYGPLRPHRRGGRQADGGQRGRGVL